MHIFYIFMILFLSGCQWGQKDTFLNGYVEGEFRFLSTTESGIVSQIKVLKGDFVKKDQVLALIENTDSRLAMMQAQTSFDLSKVTLDRYSKLEKKKAISRSDLDNAQSTFDKAKAALDLANWHLGKDNLTAPEDGYIQNILRYAGETSSPQSPVIYFLPKTGIKVKFFVPQPLLSQIKRGQEIKVQIDGAPKPFLAKIQFISEKVEYNPPVIYTNELRDKLLFMVEAVPKDPLELKPGQPVTIEIDNGK
jgi:HlyD family secretion protein